MKLTIPSAVLVLAGAASAQEECKMPREGTWRLDAGQTTTVGGPGAGPSTGLFEMKVEGCGEQLVTTGFGAVETGRVKTFNRNGDAYHFAVSYRGFPINVRLVPKRAQTIQETMQADWSFAGGMAMTPGVISFQAAGAPMRIDPRCDCKIFVDQLRQAIESNDYFISLYSDPQLTNRPDTLDPDTRYTSDVMEQIVDLRGADSDLTTADAVALLSGDSSGEANTSAPSAESDAGEDSVVTKDAYTDAKTCKYNEDLVSDAGCAGDVIKDATSAHENVHVTACERQVALGHRWTTFSEEAKPKPYINFTHEPAVLAAEEVRAYRASSDYIRRTFADMCHRALD